MSIDESLKKKILKTIEDSNFTGTIYISKGKEELFQGGFGYADRSNKRQNQLTTRYEVASGTKFFTAIAMLQFVESGKVTLDTKLCDIVKPEYPKLSDEITIFHLLTHSSGCPDYADEYEDDDYEAIWTTNPCYQFTRPEHFLPLFPDNGPKFKPGEGFYYSNGGYILLGLALEKLSGMTYTDCIEKNILEPAGMNRSGFFRSDMLPEDCALNYIDLGDGKWKTNEFSIPVIGCADGGIYLCAEEMDMFWDTMSEHKILGRDLTDQLFSKQIMTDPDNNPNDYYGLGVWIYQKDDPVYNIRGGDPGACFLSKYSPKSGIKMTLLSNREGALWNVAEAADDIW